MLSDKAVSWIANGLTVLATSIGWIAGGYFFLDGKVGDVVSERLKKYEAVTSAQSLLRTDYADKAAAELASVFVDIKKEISSESKDSNKGINSAIIDVYLESITESEDVLTYEKDLIAIEEVLNKKIFRKFSWHSNTLGWFYLRANNLPASTKNFEVAKAAARREENPYEYVRAVRGKVFTYAAQGNTAEAIREVREAQDLIQEDSTLRMADALNYEMKFHKMQELRKLYPQIPYTVDKVVAYARNELAKQQRGTSGPRLAATAASPKR